MQTRDTIYTWSVFWQEQDERQGEEDQPDVQREEGRLFLECFRQGFDIATIIVEKRITVTVQVHITAA